MKKRILAILAIAALLAAAFGGCSHDRPAARETQTETERGGVITDTGISSETPGEGETEPASRNDGTIVVYFSCTGNTRPVAEFIEEELDADIYEIEAKVPYTEDDIRYYTDCRADREQNDPSARPEIAGELPDLSGYGVVYLGYPIWHGQAPRIISTFLESVDLSGKTVIPFCTSGSSPIGSSAEDLHALTPGAEWLDGKRFEIGASREDVVRWLETVNVNEEP